jgi:hypothetical protein
MNGSGRSSAPGELVAEELEHAVHAFAEQAAKAVTA